MTVEELENYFSELLKVSEFKNDIALNGIQVNSDKKKEINKIAFAVDACLETVEKAIESGADALVVHHGIFWGNQFPVTGTHYQLIKKMMDADLTLFAYHIPLDANVLCGNNYGLARKLELTSLKEFGAWRGMILGVKGELETPCSFAEIQKNLFEALAVSDEPIKPLGILPFGKNEISTIGIISGGASEEVEDAINENLDLYITGEISHQIYHQCKENGVNFIAAGHYNTETVGVRLLSERLKELDDSLETFFVHVPTGL